MEKKILEKFLNSSGDKCGHAGGKRGESQLGGSGKKRENHSHKEVDCNKISDLCLYLETQIAYIF